MVTESGRPNSGVNIITSSRRLLWCAMRQSDTDCRNKVDAGIRPLKLWHFGCCRNHHLDGVLSHAVVHFPRGCTQGRVRLPDSALKLPGVFHGFPIHFSSAWVSKKCGQPINHVNLTSKGVGQLTSSPLPGSQSILLSPRPWPPRLFWGLSFEFRVQGLGKGVQGLGFRVKFRV